MTSGILNRGNTHGFHELYALFFAEETNLNFNSYLTVVHSFTLHSTTNLLKANKAIPALFLSNKPQELKPLDWSKIHRYARHSHYKCKQTSRGKKDEEKKMPDLRLGNVFQLPCRRISRRWTRSGTNLVIFFEKPFARKLIYSGAKWRLTICILKSNPRQEDFSHCSATY